MYDDEEKDVKNQQILEKTRKKIEQSKLLNELRKFQKKIQHDSEKQNVDCSLLCLHN